MLISHSHFIFYKMCSFLHWVCWSFSYQLLELLFLIKKLAFCLVLVINTFYWFCLCFSFFIVYFSMNEGVCVCEYECVCLCLVVESVKIFLFFMASGLHAIFRKVFLI